MDLSRPVYIAIDYQKAWHDAGWGRHANPDAEGHLANVLAAWRGAGLPVINVRHHSREPGSLLGADKPGAAWLPAAIPREGEPVITKSVHSAFIGTDLEARLRAIEPTALLISGIQTNLCVSTTARMAGNLGFPTFVVGDACTTFGHTLLDGRNIDAETVHGVALADLRGEFATITTAADVASAVAARAHKVAATSR